MQEEVTQKTIALCIRTTKLTADVLKAAMRAYLRSHNQKKQQKMQSQKTGKVTVKQLAKQNGGMTNIEITNKNTEPMMIERVNALLSENPNLLETDKYILLHSLLGRDLYMEGQLIPIRAAEIKKVAKNNGGF